MFAQPGHNRNRESLFAVALTFLFACSFASAQTIHTPSLNARDIVLRAEAEVRHYKNQFRNLVAKETKVFRIYDKSSNLKKQRSVVSNFLVYDLSNTKGETTEFRNVLSVDGKPVANADQRAIQMFEKVSRAQSTSKELDRIQTESLRFDEEIKMYGLTLFQAIALNPAIRDVMSFELAGTATIEGTGTYLLKFRQVKQTTLIHAGANSSIGGVLDYEFDTNGLKDLDPRISGTLWIDMRSFQIVREERKLFVNASGLQAPLLLTSNEFDFDRSPFGIRTPKRITHIEYRIERNKPSTKAIEITFDYSAFTRPDVEVLTGKPKTSSQ